MGCGELEFNEAPRQLVAHDTHFPGVLCTHTHTHTRNSVIPRTIDPEWNQTFDFPFSRRIKFARVELFDKDTFSSNDFLGRTLVPLAHN